MRQTKTFPGKYEEIRNACQFVLAGAEGVGFDAKTLYHIELACDEASTNIIEHAYGGEEDGEFTVTYELIANSFRIMLEDGGESFDPSQVNEPALLSPNVSLDDVTIGGLGVHMMRKLMDEVYFTSNEGGNMVTMVKWLPDDENRPIRQRKLGDGTILVTLSGRLDQSLFPDLAVVLDDLINSEALRIIVDLSATPYVNSGGLRTLVSAWRRCREQAGDLVLTGLDERVSEIFAMVGFDKIINIFSTVQAAQGHFAN